MKALLLLATLVTLTALTFQESACIPTKRTSNSDVLRRNAISAQVLNMEYVRLKATDPCDCESPECSNLSDYIMTL